jgi:hypothetical protein
MLLELAAIILRLDGVPGASLIATQTRLLFAMVKLPSSLPTTHEGRDVQVP